ncbi:MAG: DUF4870 domain-containing protein, partial [Blastocatellia bacterium]|nr:DUF4870 domain-containing protein [Blastocatellia bacterium]
NPYNRPKPDLKGQPADQSYSPQNQYEQPPYASEGQYYQPQGDHQYKEQHYQQPFPDQQQNQQYYYTDQDYQEHPKQNFDIDLKIEPNLAAALSYLLFLVSGIAFLLIEKKSEYVRFHAVQSILFTAAWIVTYIGFFIILSTLGMVFYAIGFGLLLSILGFLVNLLYLGFFAVWVLLIYKAFQGEKWKLPFIGDIAEKQAAPFLKE